MLTDAEKKLIDDLHAIQALKFGEFKLKSGALSPFYVDLRVIISHPPILRAIAQRILDLLAPLPFSASPASRTRASPSPRPFPWPETCP